MSAAGLWRALRAAWVYNCVNYFAYLFLRLTAPEEIWRAPSNYSTAPIFKAPVPDFIVTNLYLPTVEEILVRGGLFCTAYTLLVSYRRTRDWAFWLAAAATAALFVSAHETLNANLIMVRTLSAFIACLLFLREGLIAAIFAHALHNMSMQFALFFFFVQLITLYPALRSLAREPHPVRLVPDRHLRWTLVMLTCLLALSLPALRPPPSFQGSGLLLAWAVLAFFPLAAPGSGKVTPPPLFVQLIKEADYWLARFKRHAGRCWRGEERLPRVFWGWFMAPQLLYLLMILRHKDNFVVFLPFPLFLLYGIWASIALWRCAWNAGDVLWGFVARLLSAAAVIMHLFYLVIVLAVVLFD
ncbi:MAG: CPBP family glutamic-type intramembrane protease [Elusimicrobiota bacterium]